MTALSVGFQRTGPDLARVGGKYSDDWHRDHLRSPKSVVPGSIMPSYHWLETSDLSGEHIADDLSVQAALGGAVHDEMIAAAKSDLRTQATTDAADADASSSATQRAQVRDFDGNPQKITEADALIAYLQMLGTQGRLQALRQQGQHSVTTMPATYKMVAEFAQTWGPALFRRGIRCCPRLRALAFAQEPVRRGRPHAASGGLIVMSERRHEAHRCLHRHRHDRP